MENVIKLTVLVMAYKRKDYLKEALLSVLNQTIPRSEYEIICIKGFQDEDLSAFMRQNNIMELFCDGTLGERLVAGLKNSSYDIILFLDDDDIFREDKLMNVRNAFVQSECVYFHNNVNLMDRDSRSISNPFDPYSKQIDDTILWSPLRGFKSIIRHRGDFNMSSIAVLKGEICKYNNILSKINGSPDTITFFLLLQENRPFFFSNEKLTMYRIHDSETNMPKDKERTLDVSLRYYNSRLICYRGLTNEKVKKLFLGYLLESKFGAYIAGAEYLKPSFKELLKLFYIGMAQPSAFYLRLCVAVLIYSKFPGYVDRIRNERASRKYNEIR